jgi:hypothetical protein
MTQSVAITCAQIAIIPKNNASEASVATSPTATARPMSSLHSNKRPKIHEFALVVAGNGKFNSHAEHQVYR